MDITIHIPALDRLVDVLKDMPVPAGAKPAAATPAPKPAGRPPKGDTPPAEAPAETPAADSAAPSTDDLIAQAKTAAIKYQAANTRDALAALITKHGGQNISTIPADNLPAFIAEATV